MKTFINDDFLLKTATARTLYHEFAKTMPIIDYHCHLSPKEIADDKAYKNIAEIWLHGDHYKWRAMRSYGIAEEYITGDRSDKEKFTAFAKIMPYLVGNPLYHWCHLELKRYFDIDMTLCKSNAEVIWDLANKRIVENNISAKSLITGSDVEVLCTTDDPTDDLAYHKKIKTDLEFNTKVLPTFRPDKAINIERDTFLPWIKGLEAIVGYQVNSLEKLLGALEARMDYFHANGCRLADHALDQVEYLDIDQRGLSEQERNRFAQEVFQKALVGKFINQKEKNIFKSVLVDFCGKAYHNRGWVMQLHIGALRNNNRRMYHKLGADIGFDSIDDNVFAEKLSCLLGDLDITNELPKTIIYTLNPSFNYVVGTMIGNFQGNEIKGKMQFGSGWWFNDQKDGMVDQLKSLANLGVLSSFVGMLTDSRSFLSYTRHEYFRRILCNYLGDMVEDGEYPRDMEVLGEIVRDISYYNAKQYFGV